MLAPICDKKKLQGETFLVRVTFELKITFESIKMNHIMGKSVGTSSFIDSQQLDTPCDTPLLAPATTLYEPANAGANYSGQEGEWNTTL